jgi:hypothetical protein
MTLGEPAYSTDNAILVAMAHWNVEHSVFSVESSMLNVEEQFQIVPLYSCGLKHLELLDLSLRGNHLAFPVQYGPRKTLVDTVRRAVLASPRRSARRQPL